jgi:phospholipid transport system substrate-binding protein
MKKLPYPYFIFNMAALVLCLLVGTSASAKAQQSAEDIRQTVEINVAELLEKFYEERDTYDTEPDRFLKNMDLALSKIVDFRRIAGRVMGKYARKASKEQKNRFVDIFKRSLYSTYTKTLIESGVSKINVTKAKLNTRSDKKATVDLEVISDNGSVFPVIYSMHKSKDGRWMLENVIVFGVNVGLAFRDRFEIQARKNRGDLDAVIDSWTVDLEIKKDEGAKG